MNDIPVFFESMLCYNGNIPMIGAHYKRIQQTANLIRRETSISIQAIEDLVYGLNLAPNQYFKIRLRFGLKNNELTIDNYEVIAVDSQLIFSKTPISLSIFSSYKPQNAYMNCKQLSSLLYQDSILHAQSNNADQSIILNSNNEIVETSHSNIYFIKNNNIYTPPLQSGGVSGVFRQYLLEKYDLEERIILKNEIYEYDEIFLSNAIKGIILVKSVDQIPFKYLFSNYIRAENAPIYQRE